MSFLIRSISSASEEQFTALHQRQANDCPLKDYLEECKSKQKIALKDAQRIKELGGSALKIGEKLNKIVNEAKKALTISDRKNAVEVEEEGYFKVSGFDLREGGYDACDLCDYEITGPTNYTVKNLSTNKKITFRDLILHFILVHEYFAKAEKYRLDPTKTWKVLGFTKT